MAVAQSREHDFADELSSLISRYADVPRGTRSAFLFTGIAALIAAEKGALPTATEFCECVMALVKKAAINGMMIP